MQKTGSSIVPFGSSPDHNTEGENSNMQYNPFETEIQKEIDAIVGPTVFSCDNAKCDDGNACTKDSCDPVAGCTHNAIDCSDNDVCTTDSCYPATGCTTEPVVCDDGNACTKDSCDPATGCTAEPIVCDDVNESTSDSCQEGVCNYQPIGSTESDYGSRSSNQTTDNLSIIQNNSTALAAANSLGHFDRRKCRGDCDDGNACTDDACVDGNCTHTPKICNDNNPGTYDYCYGGKCTNTTTKCDDQNNCTADSFDGVKCVYIPKKCDDRNACTDDTCVNGDCVYTRKICNDGNACTDNECDRRNGCYYPSKCDDGNPCTIDRCDRYGHCTHSQVVCGYGQTCIDGVCRYPYYYYYPDYNFYPYYSYDVPYVPPTPVAAAPTAPKPQSYTIPAGTSITLPWGGSMLAAEALQVYNGLAYPGAKPISFERELGSPSQVASVGRMALSAMNQWEMIGLAWKEAGFNMTLIQPNKIALPAQGDGQNVVHFNGSNYDYYFLRSPAAGIWTVQIMPVNAASSGTGYSLISGLVQGPIPTQTNIGRRHSLLRERSAAQEGRHPSWPGNHFFFGIVGSTRL